MAGSTKEYCRQCGEVTLHRTSSRHILKGFIAWRVICPECKAEMGGAEIIEDDRPGQTDTRES